MPAPSVPTTTQADPHTSRQGTLDHKYWLLANCSQWRTMAIVGLEWLLILVVNVVCAVLVYRSATHRRMPDSRRMLWTLVALVLGIVGLVLYLLVARDRSRTCPNCGTATEASTKFCPNCGFDLKALRLCMKCGREARLGQKFCDNCGTKLD